MPALPRVLQKIFGGDLTPSGNVAVFGSLAAGAPAYSSDPAVIQSLAAFPNGWAAAVLGNKSPAMEDMNGLFLLITQQLAYILQSGVPEYDATTTYWSSQFCRIGRQVYTSQTDNNTGNNPASDTTNWLPWLDQARGAAVSAAWVEFDGINVDGSGHSILHSSFNIDYVVKNAGGSYTIHFLTPMNSVHYVFSGSCGSEDGGPYGAGDDGLVVGNVTGQGNAVHSATACRVFTINPTNKALVSPGNVSVIFFGR